MVQYLFQVQIVCMAGHTVHKCPDEPAPIFFFERNISWNIVIMIHHKDNRLDCIWVVVDRTCKYGSVKLHTWHSGIHF